MQVIFYILGVITAAISGYFGAWYWIPAWYGWVSLAIGIIASCFIAIPIMALIAMAKGGGGVQ